MSMNQIVNFQVNPALDDLLNQLTVKYSSMFPGFAGLTLFGSQATGRWNKDSDVDVGLITDDASQINTMKLFWDIYQEFQNNNFKLCTHNNPDELVLNMDYNKRDLIKSLEVYSTELAQVKDFHTIRGKVEERKLFEMYPFCLPFGKVSGIKPRVQNAQSYVHNLIQCTRDPAKVETQLNRVLSFMYHN